MATVSKAFKDNFDFWAAHKVKTGEFSDSDMEEMRGLIRKDLSPGEDQLRRGCFYLDANGNQITACIDDHEERYALWTVFFAEEVLAITGIQRLAA